MGEVTGRLDSVSSSSGSRRASVSGALSSSEGALYIRKRMPASSKSCCTCIQYMCEALCENYGSGPSSMRRCPGFATLNRQQHVLEAAVRIFVGERRYGIAAHQCETAQDTLRLQLNDVFGTQHNLRKHVEGMQQPPVNQLRRWIIGRTWRLACTAPWQMAPSLPNKAAVLNNMKRHSSRASLVYQVDISIAVEGLSSGIPGRHVPIGEFGQESQNLTDRVGLKSCMSICITRLMLIEHHKTCASHCSRNGTLRWRGNRAAHRRILARIVFCSVACATQNVRLNIVLDAWPILLHACCMPQT